MRTLFSKAGRELPVTRYSLLVTIISALLLTALLFFIPTAYSGPRNIGQIENIDGIPYPMDSPPDKGEQEGVVLVTEKLAHADIYLEEPVFAKELTLNITFDPKNLESLAVGIRQDPFWLSYSNRVEIYRRAGETPGVGEETPGVKEARLIIPLTDKLQDADRSVDLMFFADTGSGFAEVDEGIDDTTDWELNGLTAEVYPVMPTQTEFKDYIRSLLKRERPL